jgi:hypothetical protein
MGASDRIIYVVSIVMVSIGVDVPLVSLLL